VAGSFRTVAADWLWLQTNLAWEARDPTRVRRLIDLTLRADPGSRYFRLNSARMLAYDLPAWQREAEPGVPVAVRARRRVAAAEEALRLLEFGLRSPGDAALHVEMGSICLYALGDRARAAECFRQAAALPDAPDYAGRIFERLQTGKR